jgi:NAD(P) transhydrogenase subunit alpha
VTALAIGLSMHAGAATTTAVSAAPHMNEVLEYLTVFILSVFVGIEVISKVPSILHTPLMSGSNAIHGVILVGAMLVLGQATTTPEIVLGVLAVFLATLNVVGGFVVTDRMLEMFKGKPREKQPDEGAT